MAYVNFAVTINTARGRSVNFAEAVTPAAAGVPDRASVADLTFQQIDLQADAFNTSPIVVSATPGGPGITLGPGGVGRVTLGPFGTAPLRLAELYGTGLGVVRITGVTGGTGVDPMAAELPAPHHLTHEPVGSDAITNLHATVLTAGVLDPARLPASVARRDEANAFASTLAERGRTVPMGEWQTVPFTPGNVTADANGTWTATSDQILVQRFALVGQTLHYLLAIVDALVGGVPGGLAIVLPPGYAVATTFTTACLLTVGGLNEVGIAVAQSGYHHVAIYRLGGGAMSYPVGPTSVYGAITFEVVAV